MKTVGDALAMHTGARYRDIFTIYVVATAHDESCIISEDIWHLKILVGMHAFFYCAVWSGSDMAMWAVLGMTSVRLLCLTKPPMFHWQLDSP